MDKINKAAAGGIILFSVVLAGFIGARVDQTTIALLGGTFLGLFVAVPATALVLVLVMRRRDDQHERMSMSRQHAPMPPSPPQYWMMPNQPYDVRPPTHPQPLPQPMAMPEFMLPANRRRFYVIGDGGDVKELTAPAEYGDDDTRF